MSGTRSGRDAQIEIPRPRLSMLHVLNQVRMRLVDIQVWDVAGTMTFYTVLSVIPGAVAVVSLLSMIGIGEESLLALSGMFREIFPSVNPTPYLNAVAAVSTTGGGVLGLALGTLGSLLSASNGVAAFHRCLHRVFDTREGRPFLWFRTIVFAETVVIVAVVLLAIGMVIVGGEASQRFGDLIGIPRIAFEAWNLVKWPILLVMLIIGVSLAYYLFPNVKLPRYRLMTLGSTLSVLVLFGSAVALGRLMERTAAFTEILTVLNSLIGVLLVIWLANIVIVSGAALDAESLRARQIAAGLPAWDRILLETDASHSLDALAAHASWSAELGRAVAEANSTGQPLRRARSPWIVDARNLLAVNPPRDRPISTVQSPRDQDPTDPQPPTSSGDDRA